MSKPTGVPSDEKLWSLANNWSAHLKVPGKVETLYSEYREVRDRTQAAKDKEDENLKDRLAECRLILFDCNRRSAKLEAELKSARAKLQQYDVDDFCDLSYEVDKRVKEARAKALREVQNKVIETCTPNSSVDALYTWLDDERRAAEKEANATVHNP